MIPGVIIGRVAYVEGMFYNYGYGLCGDKIISVSPIRNYRTPDEVPNSIQVIKTEDGHYFADYIYDVPCDYKEYKKYTTTAKKALDELKNHICGIEEEKIKELTEEIKKHETKILKVQEGKLIGYEGGKYQ